MSTEVDSLRNQTEPQRIKKKDQKVDINILLNSKDLKIENEIFNILESKCRSILI